MSNKPGTKKKGKVVASSELDVADYSEVKSSSFGADIPDLPRALRIYLSYSHEQGNSNPQPNWLLEHYGLTRLPPLAARGIRTIEEYELACLSDAESLLEKSGFSKYPETPSDNAHDQELSLKDEAIITQAALTSSASDEAESSKQKFQVKRTAPSAAAIEKATLDAEEIGLMYWDSELDVPLYLPSLQQLAEQDLSFAFSEYDMPREVESEAMKAAQDIECTTKAKSDESPLSFDIATGNNSPKHVEPLQISSLTLGDSVLMAAKSSKHFDSTIGNSAIWSTSPSLLNRIGEDPRKTIRTNMNEFVGLRNLGATCYMAGIFQTLYFNQEFRDLIFCLPVDSTNKIGLASDDYLSEMRSLFMRMLLGAKRSCDPSTLAHAFKVRVDIQQDAQEFNSLLLNALETRLPRLKLTSLGSLPLASYRNLQSGNKVFHNISDNVIRHMFQGALQSMVVCRECGFRSTREETFFELSLRIKGQATLENSLRTYFEMEELVEGNKYLCTGCKQKVDAFRVQSFSRIPPTLNMQLLRFDYDMKTGAKKKVQEGLFIPMEINLSKFTNESVNSQLESLLEASDRASKKVKVDFGQMENAPNDQVSDPDFTYSLVAVLRHQGTSSEHGHYVCDVFDTVSRQWWFFDDERSICVGKLPKDATYDELVLLSKQSSEMPEVSSDVSMEGAFNDTNRKHVKFEGDATCEQTTEVKTEVHSIPMSNSNPGLDDFDRDHLLEETNSTNFSCTNDSIGSKRSRQMRSDSNNAKEPVHDTQSTENDIGITSSSAYMLVYRKCSSLYESQFQPFSKYHMKNQSSDKTLSNEELQNKTGFAFPVRTPCESLSDSVHTLAECDLPTTSNRTLPDLAFPPCLPSPVESSDMYAKMQNPSDYNHISFEISTSIPNNRVPPIGKLSNTFKNCVAAFAGPPEELVVEVAKENEEYYGLVREYQQRAYGLYCKILERRKQVAEFLQVATIRVHSPYVANEAVIAVNRVIDSLVKPEETQAHALSRLRGTPQFKLCVSSNIKEATLESIEEQFNDVKVVKAETIPSESVEVLTLSQLLSEESDFVDQEEEYVSKIQSKLSEAQSIHGKIEDKNKTKKTASKKSSNSVAKKKEEDTFINLESDDEEGNGDKVPDEYDPQYCDDDALHAAINASTNNIHNDVKTCMKGILVDGAMDGLASDSAESSVLCTENANETRKEEIIAGVQSYLSHLYSQDGFVVNSSWLARWLVGRTLADDIGTIYTKMTSHPSSKQSSSEVTGGALETSHSSGDAKDTVSASENEKSISSESGDPITINQDSSLLIKTLANRVWKAHHPLWPGSLALAQKDLLCSHGRFSPLASPHRFKVVSEKAFNVILKSYVDMVKHNDASYDDKAFRSEVPFIMTTQTCFDCTCELLRLREEERRRRKLHLEILALLPQKPVSHPNDEIAGAWISRTFIRDFKAALRKKLLSRDFFELAYGRVPKKNTSLWIPIESLGHQSSPTRFLKSKDEKHVLVGTNWLDSNANKSIVCSHEGMAPDKKTRIAVSSLCWERILAAFPDTTSFSPCYKETGCVICTSGVSQAAEAAGVEAKTREEAKKLGGKLYRMSGSLMTSSTPFADTTSQSGVQAPAIFGFNAHGCLTQFAPVGVIKYPWWDQAPPSGKGRFIMLPTSWVERWRLFIDNPKVLRPDRKVDVSTLLCSSHTCLRVIPFPVGMQSGSMKLSNDCVIDIQNSRKANSIQIERKDKSYVNVGVPGTWPGSFVLIDEGSFTNLGIECTPLTIYVEVRATDKESVSVDSDSPSPNLHRETNGDQSPELHPEARTESPSRDNEDCLEILDVSVSADYNSNDIEENIVAPPLPPDNGKTEKSNLRKTVKSQKSAKSSKPWEDIIVSVIPSVCLPCIHDQAMKCLKEKEAFLHGSIIVQVVESLELAIALSLRDAAMKKSSSPSKLIAGVLNEYKADNTIISQLDTGVEEDEALTEALSLIAALEEETPKLASSRRASARVAAKHSRKRFGTRIDIQCSGYDTVEILKLKLFSELDISPSQQVLVYEGKVISNDGAELISFSIVDEDIVYLFYDLTRPLVHDQSSGAVMGSTHVGFGNTALWGTEMSQGNFETVSINRDENLQNEDVSVICPICTFANPPSQTLCNVCSAQL